MNYIPLKVLQKAYCEHNITEFLKRVESTKVLKNTHLVLLANDMIESEEGIISALVTEIQYRNNGVIHPNAGIPLETLKYMYANHTLMNYLKNASTDVLEVTYSLLISNDITDDIEGILSGIYTELEYRTQEEQNNKKVSNKRKELSIEFLELLRRNHQLTDYLKQFESHEEIKRMIALISANDITEERVDILSALMIEDEYRTQLENELNMYTKSQSIK